MRSFRVDLSTAQPSDLRKLSDGSVAIPALLARTGVQVYRFADGTVRREYRPDAEVFSPASLDSWRSATLTVGHPTQSVDPTNWRNLAVGHIDGAPSRDDSAGVGYLRSMCIVRDRAALDSVNRGDLRELSAGYFVDYDATPGVTDAGEPYDGIQRNIVGNHIALLPAGMGRAGPNVRLYVDSSADQNVGYSVPEEQTTMTLEEALAAIKAAEKRIDALTAERDVLKARTDAAPAPAAIASQVHESVTLRLAALRVDAAIVLLTTDAAGVVTYASDRDVMTAALKVASPKLTLDGKSDEYVRVAFDMACAATPATPAPRKDTRETTNVVKLQTYAAPGAKPAPTDDGPEGRDDADDGGSVARAKAKHDNALKDAWRPKARA